LHCLIHLDNPIFKNVCPRLSNAFRNNNYNYEGDEDEAGGAYRANGGEENRVYVSGRKARGKRPVGRPRRRLVDDIKMDLVEVGWGDLD
jgi:hypothetical protein